MKIVCDNCATKYSIADEKVRGKVFKIRCKKCSHIIVVRGGDGATASAESTGGEGAFPNEESAPPAPRGSGAPAPLGTGEAVWHLVVDREQIGPLTREEVHAKFRGGEVDLETYAWREGFADWLRLGSIEDFKDLGGGDAATGEGATRRTDTADLFATAAAAPQEEAPAGNSDLFGGHNAPSAATGEAPMPANEIFGGAGGNLFSAPAAQAAAPAAAAAPAPRPQRTSSPGFTGAGSVGGAAMAASEPAADAGGSQKMTGQRNENSVLFSLNNLQALASGGGGAPKPASSEAAAPRPGFANSQTEGSGLIDIRAMAASTLAASPAGPTGTKSEEPAFATAPLFSPMAAPILMPAPASGPPKWIWALLGVGVLAVVGIVIVGVLLLTRKPEPPPVVAVAPPVNPAVPVAQPTNPVAQPANPVANPANPAANPAAPPAADGAHHKDHAKTPKEPKGTAAVPKGETPKAEAPKAETPAATPKKSAHKDELDDLLNNAAPDKPAPKHSAPKQDDSASAGGDLPDQLDKGAIVGGMSKVKTKVADCYTQYKVPGLANVSVTIGKSGHVSSANVSGSFSGTPTGSCVEKAVKSATFPPFKGSPQTINYPFMLR
jgi:predicted Zn finger-like uncharacterized protein